MGKIKAHWTDELFEEQLRFLMYPKDYWLTKDGRLVPIDDMDFQHLENIVNLFSQEGTTVDPTRQAAFENVMLRYLRLQAEINDVHKDIL
jgi:hypothetical protein